MPWAKLDDRFHNNRKVRRVWRRCPVALGLHVMAITYCAGELTDGFVDEEFVFDQIPDDELRAEVILALISAELWTNGDGDGWWINDYTEYNPSREEVLAKRERTAAAGRLGGLAKAAAKQDAKQNAKAVAKGSLRSLPTPDPTRPEPDLKSKAPSAAPTDVDRVFEAWLASAGKTGRTVLSPKRRRLIQLALKAYPLADVLDAVEGWRYDDFYTGNNDRGKQFNDLELLLRDAEHIERFRDLKQKRVGARNTLSGMTPEEAEAYTKGGLEAWQLQRRGQPWQHLMEGKTDDMDAA